MVELRQNRSTCSAYYNSKLYHNSQVICQHDLLTELVCSLFVPFSAPKAVATIFNAFFSFFTVFLSFWQVFQTLHHGLLYERSILCLLQQIHHHTLQEVQYLPHSLSPAHKPQFSCTIFWCNCGRLWGHELPLQSCHFIFWLTSFIQLVFCALHINHLVFLHHFL